MLHPWQGHPRYRHRHIPGSYAMYGITGQEEPDGTITIANLDIDPNYWQNIALDPDD